MILTMMGGGWWAYLQKEREGQKGSERDGEYCQYTNIILIKKTKKIKTKKNPTQPFKQCTTTSTFPSTNNPSNSSVQRLFELNSKNVLT